MERSSSRVSTVRINFLKSELIQAYKEEELYQKQRSKDKWATKGKMLYNVSFLQKNRDKSFAPLCFFIIEKCYTITM